MDFWRASRASLATFVHRARQALRAVAFAVLVLSARQVLRHLFSALLAHTAPVGRQRPESVLPGTIALQARIALHARPACIVRPVLRRWIKAVCARLDITAWRAESVWRALARTAWPARPRLIVCLARQAMRVLAAE